MNFLSLSLSEEDQNYDSLSIKPPQPQADFTIDEKAKKYRDHSSRSLSYRGNEKATRRGKMPKEEKKEKGKSDRSERTELKHEDRYAIESRKEDLRDRLERDRRSRKNKEHEGHYDAVDTRRQHDVKGHRKNERTQPKFEPVEIERTKTDSKIHDVHKEHGKRKKLAVSETITSSPEDLQLTPEKSKKSEDGYQNSKLVTEDCSDEGKGSLIMYLS